MIDNVPGVESGGRQFGLLSGCKKLRGVIGALINSAHQLPNLMGWNYSIHQRVPMPSWDRAMGSAAENMLCEDLGLNLYSVPYYLVSSSAKLVIKLCYRLLHEIK